MTLYYSLVFVLLVLEMGLFVTLIVPLPHTIKRKMFNFISESVIVAKLQYGLKVGRTPTMTRSTEIDIDQITFIFILILFVDSCNRVYRVQQEMSAFGRETTAG